ncbi:hypothetical protein SKAU_G00203810 [Synaphobranchus kaupii]|uniref:Uncharacterized protein n=1 Tax=Synaphobranchus kaupii TaxID=118154 RepID=A0A9Q1FGB0_SYNKA|nr:hypothetical protein SKAU_G00203810 [Synaphobranchus kaupii]
MTCKQAPGFGEAKLICGQASSPGKYLELPILPPQSPCDLFRGTLAGGGEEKYPLDGSSASLKGTGHTDGACGPSDDAHLCKQRKKGCQDRLWIRHHIPHESPISAPNRTTTTASPDH